MNFVDNNSVKMLRVGNSGHHWLFRVDTALTILLRHLAFPSRFADHNDEFNMPNTRIAEAFHAMNDYLFVWYAHKLTDTCRLQDMFPAFAPSQAFANMQCPFDNNIALIDGNFMSICRPGGLGNWLSNLDQCNFYSGKEKQHGIKFLAGVFPKGMTFLHGPARGKDHDSSMLRASGWLKIMRAYELLYHVRMQMFGDAGFALSRYLQTMQRGFLTRRGRTFNSVMSRIRIYIENMFAGQATIFNFLSFSKHLRLGGRNIDRLYVTANFLMNVRTCFYGNQMTIASGMRPPELEDLLRRAE